MSEWSQWTEYKGEKVSYLGELYGVYLLAVKQNDPAKAPRVFYVGSGEIKGRLQDHLLPDEKKCIADKVKKFYCYFAYREISGGKEEWKKEEQRLINYHKGQGNAECNEKDAI